MAQQAPVIDDRSAARIRQQTREGLYKTLKSYGWKENPAADEAYGGEACDALVHIFSQYCHHVIERINRNREKSFLAFLDLLGNTRIAAQPARTVVTYALAAGARGRLLPAGTRLQAAAQGNGPALYFETEQDVWLSNLRLDAVLAGNLPCPALTSQDGSAGDTKDSAPLSIFNEAGENSYTFRFVLPDGARPQDGMPVEFHVWLDSPLYDPETAKDALAASEKYQLQWALRADDSGSAKVLEGVAVEDDTACLTRSGAIRLLAPPAAYWGWHNDGKQSRPSFCLTVTGTRQEKPPRLRRVALNSVAAIQAMTLVGEVLGSSAGQSHQRYFAAQTPVLEDPVVTVLEVPPSSAAELLTSEAGWVAWKEMPDFCTSGPGDRHYVLDHQTGEVRFGDGKRGMVPPAGARNVRLSRYRAGGGTAGNLASGLLKIPVSNTRDIAGVGNFFAATGGSDAEQPPQLLDRAPRSLRHRQRAVTQGDYEDLALQATTEVARAKCVPLHDLLSDPRQVLNSGDEEQGAGKVSVIIVPRGSEPGPLPTLDLIRRVRTYLRERACVEAAVEVVGPLYVPVNVGVRLQIDSERYKETVDQEARRRLAGYLHPLTGGRKGTGWSWGREPKASDFYAVLDGIPHVRHFELLAVGHDAEIAYIVNTRRFLVCAGKLTIDISAKT